MKASKGHHRDSPSRSNAGGDGESYHHDDSNEKEVEANTDDGADPAGEADDRKPSAKRQRHSSSSNSSNSSDGSGGSRDQRRQASLPAWGNPFSVPPFRAERPPAPRHYTPSLSSLYPDPRPAAMIAAGYAREVVAPPPQPGGGAADPARLAYDALLAASLDAALDRAILERALLDNEQRNTQRMLSSLLIPLRLQTEEVQRSLMDPQHVVALDGSLLPPGQHSAPAPSRPFVDIDPSPGAPIGAAPRSTLFDDRQVPQAAPTQSYLWGGAAMPSPVASFPPRIGSSPTVLQRLPAPMLGHFDASVRNMQPRCTADAARSAAAAAPSFASSGETLHPVPPIPYKMEKRSYQATRYYNRTSRMTAPSDRSCLSSFQTLLRAQVIFFEAGPLDVQASAQGRNKPIKVGQVGILCRHCCDVAPHSRPRGAAYFPHKLGSIYQSTQNMMKNHFGAEGGCPNAPAAVNDGLRTERTKKGVVYGGGQQYWPETAAEAGVVESGEGLAFAPAGG